MKTSNKLLFGLLSLVIIGMIGVNIILKREMSHPAVDQIININPVDTNLVTLDSLMKTDKDLTK